MNSRQKKLILKIQNKWNLYLSEIAKAFNVSEKTIRNDIVQINSIYGTQKLIIENSKIKLTSPIDIKSLFFRNYQKNKTDFSVNDRRLDILYELVINDQHFSYSFLSNHYMVSKSSIAKDIDYIKKRIKKYHLVLSFDQTGSFISGKESDKQQFIRQIISNQLTGEPRKLIFFENQFTEWIGSQRMSVIHDKLIDFFVRNNFSYSDESLNTLALTILIIVKRAANNHLLEENLKQDLKITNLAEYPLIYNLLNCLKDGFKHNFSSNEIFLITSIFIGLGFGLKNSMHFSQEFKLKVADLINSVGRALEIDFISDERLFHNLELHLYQLIYRAKSNFQIKNPLLNDIRNKYPSLFAVVWLFVNQFIEKYNIKITLDEVAFITLHFQTSLDRSIQTINALIVCPNGIGTSAYVKAQISKFFPNISAHLANTRDLDIMTLDNFDFILSTISLKKNYKLPVLEVSTLINFNELKQISELYVRSLYRKYAIQDRYIKQQQDVMYINHLIGQNIFQGNFKSYLDILNFLIGKANENGFIEKGFRESVLKREKLMSTYLSGKTALPHGNPSLVKKSFLIALVLSKDTDWQGKMVNVVLLLGIKSSDVSHSQKLMSFLMDKINENENKDLRNYLFQLKEAKLNAKCFF